MNNLLKLAMAGAACVLGAGAAHAQAAPPGAPPGPGYATENTTVRNGGDTTERDAMNAREAEISKLRANRGEKARTIRSVPARPEDVTVGAEVRDKKGVRVGAIESVGVTAAVLKADGGAVEVPLEALGKDSKGLLIGMTKAEFDALVASVTKPAG